MESQLEPAVHLVGATIVILLVPYVSVFIISLGTVWIPPSWFTPLQFDAYLKWTMYVSVVPLIRLPPQDFALAVPTRVEEVLYGHQLMPPLHHLSQTLHSAQEWLFSRVELAVQIVLRMEVVNKDPPCM